MPDTTDRALAVSLLADHQLDTYPIATADDLDPSTQDKLSVDIV